MLIFGVIKTYQILELYDPTGLSKAPVLNLKTRQEWNWSTSRHFHSGMTIDAVYQCEETLYLFNFIVAPKKQDITNKIAKVTYHLCVLNYHKPSRIFFLKIMGT